jgi:hypothetical protein
LENVSGKKILNIRTDQGTEYKGQFLEFIETHGIAKQTSTAYEHNHPGQMERIHQTIMTMGRAMLKESKLPAKFYSEAQLTAVYLYNRLTHGGDSKTPYEHIFGRKPNLSHLQPFGAVCYSFIPIEKRSKLDDTTQKCRLLGYGDVDNVEQYKAYKLLVEEDGRIVYSKNVTFPIKTKFEELPDKDAYEEEDNSADLNYQYEYDSDASNSEEQPTDYLDVIEEDPTTDEENPTTDDYTSNSEGDNSDDLDYQDESDVTSNLVQSFDLPRQAMLSCLATTVNKDCPNGYEEAMRSPEKEEWKKAMDLEMDSIKSAGTYVIKPMPACLGKLPVKNRWVYTKKYDKDGNVKRYKARLVAKGYTQVHGIDYFETFAPVAKFKSIRTLAAIGAKLKLTAFQDDVPTAFLRGNLQEEVWMDQPQGYETEEEKEKCLLKKTLYGLKQSPREWNAVIHKYLLSQGFKQSMADPCIYIKRESHEPIFVGVYVDDIITLGEENAAHKFRKDLRKYFNITEGGILEWYLGVSFDQLMDKTIVLNQTQYLKDKLEEFSEFIGSGGASTPLPLDVQVRLQQAENETYEDSKFPYRKIVGSLMYAMLGTRPDLAVAVSTVCKFLEKPKPTHIKLVQHILRYLRINSNYNLTYQPHGSIRLSCYADAAYANEGSYKSRSGYCCLIGGSLVSWYSAAQPIVAQSSAEAEYYAAVSAANECIWFKSLLSDLGFQQQTVEIFEDNLACIALTKNPEDHKRTKHIQVKYHVVRDYVAHGLVKFTYCRTGNQLGDVFTKALNGSKIRTIMKQLGLYRKRES